MPSLRQEGIQVAGHGRCKPTQLRPVDQQHDHGDDQVGTQGRGWRDAHYFRDDQNRSQDGLQEDHLGEARLSRQEGAGKHEEHEGKTAHDDVVDQQVASEEGEPRGTQKEEGKHAAQARVQPLPPIVSGPFHLFVAPLPLADITGDIPFPHRPPPNGPAGLLFNVPGPDPRGPERRKGQPAMIDPIRDAARLDGRDHRVGVELLGTGRTPHVDALGVGHEQP